MTEEPGRHPIAHASCSCGMTRHIMPTWPPLSAARMSSTADCPPVRKIPSVACVVLGRPWSVRAVSEHLGGDVLGEVELGRIDACRGVDDQVDVHGPAGIPAGIDGSELDIAGAVGRLKAAQERLVEEVLGALRCRVDVDCGVVRRVAGVPAVCVAVPDLDIGVLDCGARVRAQAESQTERRAGPALGDVAAARLLTAAVGALLLLGQELAPACTAVEERGQPPADGLTVGGHDAGRASSM